MNITPDQARELLDGTTTGPWRALHDQWEDEDGTPCEDFYVLGGPDGILHTEDFDPDTHNPVANTTLAAAAPDLAQTIAALRWEYAVETMVEGEWEDIWDLWSTEKETRKEYADLIHDDEDGDYRLVRRLVSPVEVVE